jgi:insulysin
MSFHSLDISIPLEYQPPYWKHKPAGFICHLLGHEGPGSLCSYLKNKGWITSIRSETQDLGRGFAIFRITFQLTREGFSKLFFIREVESGIYLELIVNYRTVVLASFKYLALLRSSDFPAYHQRELAMLSSTRFRFQEKKRPDDYAKWIANTMTWPVPKEYLLCAPVLTWDWDNVSGQSKIREYLESFRITEARVVLMAQADEHAKLDTTTPWNKEPWYGTEYRVQHFDKEFIEQVNFWLWWVLMQMNLSPHVGARTE